jgi:hypothetical protein
LQTSLESLVAEYRKYEESTTALFALSRLVIDNEKIGRLYGITKQIQVSGGRITPDVSASCDEERGALFLELKWSLTPATSKDELLKLKKYCEASFSWGTVQVQRKDVVLVVAQEDAETAVSGIKELIRQGNTFLENVSIWKWYFARPRSTGQMEAKSEVLWISKIYGKTGNQDLEALISSASGFRVPDDVLEFRKYSYRFTKDKPPVQYTIATLLLHVLSSLRTRPGKESLKIKPDLTDIVYERSKSFFPGPEAAESVQIRKKWIREALEAMIAAGMKEVTIPFQTTGNLDEFVCKMLLPKTRGRGKPGMPRVRKPKAPDFTKQTRLD